jgi:hypothetical protein
LRSRLRLSAQGCERRAGAVVGQQGPEHARRRCVLLLCSSSVPVVSSLPMLVLCHPSKAKYLEAVCGVFVFNEALSLILRNNSQ